MLETTQERSTYKAEVIEVVLEKHDNADSLSIVRPFGGYTVVTQTEQWKNYRYGIYIPPDTLVDVNRPEFSFLTKDAKNGKARIKAKKIRGVQSFGLLIPCTKLDAQIGDNMWSYLDLEHYEPVPEGLGSINTNNEKGPDLAFLPSKYDIDALRRYKNCFTAGEMVYVSSKLNGSNALYIYTNGRMWAKSRSFWKAPDENCLWWKALKNTPQVEEWCRRNEGHFLLGEVYGQVKGWQYDCGDVRPKFRAFDIQTPDGRWFNSEEFLTSTMGQVPTVPNLGIMPFDFDKLINMAEMDCPITGKIQEGLVVKPLEERYDYKIGRVFLKLISARYLEGK